VIKRRLTRESTGPLRGLVLTGDLRGADGRIVLGKGTVLTDADATALRASQSDEVHALELEAGEMHEAEAGRRLAHAVVGPGVMVGECSGGQWPLRARHRGVLRVAVDALAALNACDDLSVYTLYDRQVVDDGEAVARSKIIPFVVSESVIALGERVARRGGPLIDVQPFRSATVAALVQESLGVRDVARFRAAFGEKVAWFGGTLQEPLVVGRREGAVTDALRLLLDRPPELIVIAGTRAMDPLDPVFAALDAVGAAMVRRGMPAHPGSLCWIARRGATTIIGMPSCGVFSQATVFDLLLTAVFAGDALEPSLLARFGHGGFLTRDMSFRFPPYRRARDRGEVE
jgi:hypothetical protein